MQRPLFIICLSFLVFVQSALGEKHVSRQTASHERRASANANAAEISLWKQHSSIVESLKSAMLASIRTRWDLGSANLLWIYTKFIGSWEQGTAAHGVLETENNEYSVFSPSPFQPHGPPTPALQLALSAVVRQTADGRLSQQINDAEDAAALDGASSGSAVLLGSFAPNPRGPSYWESAADKQLAYIMTVNRTSTGAISQRADGLQYW